MQIAYCVRMEKINHADMSKFLGVSPQMICDISKGRRYFGKKNAYRISELTGIPFKELTLENGNGMIKKLEYAYSHRGDL